MDLLTLINVLIKQAVENGNMPVMIDSFPIQHVEVADPVAGEHGYYIDICSVDGHEC